MKKQFSYTKFIAVFSVFTLAVVFIGMGLFAFPNPEPAPADTQRQISDLLTIFADNTSGDITPQDMRDFIVSTMSKPHGSLSIDSAAATTIGTPGTYVLMAGTTQSINTPNNITVSTAGRLTYTGTVDVHCICAATFSMTSDTNNVTASLTIYKNGSPITNVNPIQRKIGTGADVGAAAFSVPVSLSTNDYIEIYMTSDLACDLTIEACTLFIQGHTS